MSADGPLAGRTALVTGAASGIGRQVAHTLAGLGATVAAVDRDADGLRAACAGSGRLHAYAADLTEPTAILVADVAADHGGIDILVNCAGIVGPRVTLADTDDDAWDQVLDVNLRATALLTRNVLPHLIAGPPGGHIVTISSASAHRARAYSAAYACSKAALEALTRVLAGELADHSVNVNAVAPGVTATAIHGAADSDADRTARATSGAVANLFGRPSTPDDIAQCVAFLCLPQSRQITGQVIHASAGAIV